MGSYRHVIWDWNGTLLDDVAVIVAACHVGGLLACLLLVPSHFR
jgi:hypothetical protein